MTALNSPSDKTASFAIRAAVASPSPLALGSDPRLALGSMGHFDVGKNSNIYLFYMVGQGVRSAAAVRVMSYECALKA